MNIYKIVLTGGPCAGKSAAMPLIKETFTNKGYTVLFIPETATELIPGGVAPWTCGTNLEFQIIQCELQLKKEELFLTLLLFFVFLILILLLIHNTNRRLRLKLRL